MSHEIAQYLITEYYSKYKGEDKTIIPTMEQIETGYAAYQDRFLIVRDDKIKGVGVFLTLTDETFAILESLDIRRIDILQMLLLEMGPNVHFVLLCADGITTILTGLKEVKKRCNPRTISWWNPDLKKLHKYTVRD